MLSYFLFACFGAYAALVQGDAHDGCYSNQTTCLDHFRELMIDTDHFWFGSRFATDCPPELIGSTAASCRNPDPSKLSVLSRLLGLNDVTDSATLSQRASEINLAHVSFTAPETTIYACGHNFDIPALNDEKIDPLHITRISLWSLNKVPFVTWDPVTPETKYTVIVWDVGYFFLHGLYINCANGTMSTGQAIDTYHGPRNSFFAGNAYIFAVYRQTSDISTADAMRIMGINFTPFGSFSVPQYVANFSAQLMSSPSHAMVLTVVGDPYGIQFQKDMQITNRCPMLISQLPAFHQLVQAINLSVEWSNENVSTSQLSDNQYVMTLNVDMEIEYSTDDFSVSSCCEDYSITRGLFQVDAFSEQAERPAMLRNAPRVKMTTMFPMDTDLQIRDNTYTLFCVDVAPALEGQPNPQFISHWLVTNIKEADVTTGDELSPYFGPNPFNPNAPRAYMFLLYKQPVPMLNNSILNEFCPNGGQRCRITLTDVLEAFNLTELVGLNWFLAEQDAFARMRLTDLFGRPEEEACRNVPGYSNPCPAQCNNDASTLQFAVSFICVFSVFYTIFTLY